jgi:mono/diheme cytochrome c family protein
LRPSSSRPTARLALVVVWIGGLATVFTFPNQTNQSALGKTTLTVWDRVFSEAQATRGEALYRKSCAICHRADLGGSDGPSLRGPDFLGRWATVAEMLDDIRMTMPSNDPDSLTPQEYLDVIGFLFKFNGVPMGATDLAADSETLKEIITAKSKS